MKTKDSFYQAVKDLQTAWHEFMIVLAKSLYLDRILEKLRKEARE